MSANVRCAGNEQWHEPAPGRRQLPVTPCTWKGERFPTVPITRMAGVAKADFERKATAKPCPRCRGRVELIPEVER